MPAVHFIVIFTRAVSLLWSQTTVTECAFSIINLTFTSTDGGLTKDTRQQLSLILAVIRNGQMKLSGFISVCAEKIWGFSMCAIKGPRSPCVIKACDLFVLKCCIKCRCDTFHKA